MVHVMTDARPRALLVLFVFFYHVETSRAESAKAPIAELLKPNPAPRSAKNWEVRPGKGRRDRVGDDVHPEVLPSFTSLPGPVYEASAGVERAGSSSPRPASHRTP